MPQISLRVFDQRGVRDDAALVKRIAGGDTAAMHMLYERHHDDLYTFIRLRSGDDATAQDVVHDAMLDVWRQAGRFEGRSSVKTWLYRIARNKLVDRVRRSSQLSFVDVVPEVVDDTPDADTVMSAAQDAARVRACVDKLKKAQAAVVRLAFFDGLTYEEIAKVEGIPVGTVKTRIHHAKQALMYCLGRPV